MALFWGVLGITVTVLSLFALMLSQRNPKPSVWQSDFLVGSILVPLITGAGLIGCVLVIRYVIQYGAAPDSGPEKTMSAVVAVIGVLILKSMNVGKRLARYRAQTEAKQAVVHTLETTGDGAVPPETGKRAA